jgi:hypothetical protein
VGVVPVVVDILAVEVVPAAADTPVVDTLVVDVPVEADPANCKLNSSNLKSTAKAPASLPGP